jgi:hypothetical protein
MTLSISRGARPYGAADMTSTSHLLLPFSFNIQTTSCQLFPFSFLHET